VAASDVDNCSPRDWPSAWFEAGDPWDLGKKVESGVLKINQKVRSGA